MTENEQELLNKFHLTNSFNSEKISCQQCIQNHHECELDSSNQNHHKISKNKNKNNNIFSSSMCLNLLSNSFHVNHCSFLSFYSTSHLSVQSAITTINIDNNNSVSIADILQNSSDAWLKENRFWEIRENCYLIKHVSINAVEKLYSKWASLSCMMKNHEVKLRQLKKQHEFRFKQLKKKHNIRFKQWEEKFCQQ